MLKIKSYKNPMHVSPSSTLQNVFSNMCNKIDYQLQCKLEYPSAVSSPIKRNENIKKEDQQNKVKKIHHSTLLSKSTTIYKEHSPKNRIYLNVNIKNVNKKQQKLGKILQGIALNKKCQNSCLSTIRKQAVKINRFSNDQESHQELPQIEINMETMFKAYLQYYQKQVKESTLSGEMHSKIVKPFLSMFQRIKIDSKQISIKCKSQQKSFSKSQLHKIFNRYKPKLRLRSQIEQMETTCLKIYEEMYKNYEGKPIYGQEEEQKVQIEENLHDKASKFDQTSCCQIQDEIQQSCMPQLKQQQPQQQKPQQEKPKSLQMDVQELKKPSLKQRFQNRFKKNLKLLSEDANDIIRARFE